MSLKSVNCQKKKIISLRETVVSRGYQGRRIIVAQSSNGTENPLSF